MSSILTKVKIGYRRDIDALRGELTNEDYRRSGARLDGRGDAALHQLTASTRLNSPHRRMRCRAATYLGRLRVAFEESRLAAAFSYTTQTTARRRYVSQ